MSLECSCGWSGANLQSNYARGTANCPECGTVFSGIPPSDAIVVSPQQDEQLRKEAGALQLVFESPPK